MTKETDFELNRAANNYAAGPEVKGGAWSATAFIAGAEWARAQWPITPRTAEEAKPSDFGDALGLMWRDLGKKLDELSIWCGSLEGQANRIQRETHERLDLHNELIGNMLKMLARAGIESGVTLNDLDARLTHLHEVPAVLRDVGQKVEAVISLVDDLDELIRSEGGEAIEVAREDEEDEAYRPAVGMFGIGGDSSVVSLHSAGTKDDAAAKIADLEFQRDNWKAEATRLRSEGPGRYEYYTDATDAEEKIVKRPAPTLRNVLKAIEDVRALAVDAGISFDFTISTEA